MPLIIDSSCHPQPKVLIPESISIKFYAQTEKALSNMTIYRDYKDEAEMDPSLIDVLVY